MLDLCLVVDCILLVSIQQYCKLLLTVDEIVRSRHAFNNICHFKGTLSGSHLKRLEFGNKGDSRFPLDGIVRYKRPSLLVNQISDGHIRPSYLPRPMSNILAATTEIFSEADSRKFSAIDKKVASISLVKS
jgi:hypothetical protein